jgi:hypothetical protein
MQERVRPATKRQAHRQTTGTVSVCPALAATLGHRGPTPQSLPRTGRTFLPVTKEKIQRASMADSLQWSVPARGAPSLPGSSSQLGTGGRPW